MPHLEVGVVDVVPAHWPRVQVREGIRQPFLHEQTQVLPCAVDEAVGGHR